MSKKAHASGEEVFASGYILSAKGPDILKRLESVTKRLESVDQDSPPPGLDNVAAALIDDSILKSKNKVGLLGLHKHWQLQRVHLLPRSTDILRLCCWSSLRAKSVVPAGVSIWPISQLVLALDIAAGRATIGGQKFVRRPAHLRSRSAIFP